MYAHGFRFYFTPLPGFFSPFPHGTSSLSVGREYLAFEDGPPIFKQNYTCSALLDFTCIVPSCTRLSLTMARLSSRFHWSDTGLRAVPVSLTATTGISVDFFSSGYLDVSVLRVCFLILCIQMKMLTKVSGFPHSEIFGSKFVCQLTEAYRKLLRPSSPPAAKAFTVCTNSLDLITSNNLR